MRKARAHAELLQDFDTTPIFQDVHQITEE